MASNETSTWPSKQCRALVTIYILKDRPDITQRPTGVLTYVGNHRTGGVPVNRGGIHMIHVVGYMMRGSSLHFNWINWPYWLNITGSKKLYWKKYRLIMHIILCLVLDRTGYENRKCIDSLKSVRSQWLMNLNFSVFWGEVPLFIPKIQI